MGEINVVPIDRYTSAHAGMGALLARGGVPWWGALIASVGWELAENGFKKLAPELFPYSSVDSFANAAMDTAAFMVGYAATAKLMRASPTPKSEAILASVTGATIGGAAGSVLFGLVGGRFPEQDIQYARLGYRIGGAVGAATGVMVELEDSLLVAAAAALGGAVIGPVGSAAGALLSAPKETP